MRIAESERHVLSLLWENGTMTAREIAEQLNQKLGWKKATTYTMLTRCAEKGYLKRSEPHFCCTAILTKEEVCHQETDYLLEKDFNGSADLLVASLVSRKKLSIEQLKEIQALLEQMEEEK